MKRTLFLRVTDALVTVLLLVAIVFGLLWFIHTFKVFPLPDFIDAIFDKNSASTDMPDEFENNLLSLLEKEESLGEYEFLTLTHEKAEEILTAFEPLENYFWVVETVYRHDSDERRQLHRIYKKGELVRVDTVDENTDTTTVFSPDATVVINNKTGVVRRDEKTTDFDLSNTVNIATLTRVFSNSDPEVTNISMVETDDKKYLYAEILKGEGIDGVDKYFVSLDNGMVLIATSEMGGSEYFTQTTLTFDAVSVISDTAFEISILEKEALLTLQ